MNKTDYYLVIISMPLIIFAIGWVAVSLNNFYDETQLDLEISEKCGSFEAVDSSLCKIINNL